MASQAGIQQINDYSGDVNAGISIQKLIDIIPDVDTTRTSGAQAGGGYLDEMSPAAAAQLRVELIAMKAAVGLFS